MSKKIAYSATVTALGAAAIAVAFWTQMLTPYVLCGVGIGIIHKKCGFGYAFLTYLAISIIALFININAAMPFVLLLGLHPQIAAPIAALSKISPRNKKILSAIVSVALFNIAFAALYYFFSIMFLNLAAIEALLGGYFVLALLGSAVFVFYDYAFRRAIAYFDKLIK